MATRGVVVVLSTASSVEEARMIARRLVEERLAACVSVVDGVYSVYWWEGRVEESREALLIVKTSLELASRVVERIRELHSYQVPEVLVLPVAGGLASYLEWVEREARGTR